MPKKIDWDKMDTSNYGGGTGTGQKKKGTREFVKFQSGKDEKLRPIGGGIEFAKFFNRATKKSIIVELDEAPVVAQLIADKTGTEIQPNHRYAINVFDRNDENKIKVCEGSHSIFSHFGSWSQEISKENNGEKISVGHGKLGGNWKIKVTGEGKARRYSPTFLGSAPITADENAEIVRMRKFKIEGQEEPVDILDLNLVFRVCPKDKYLEWLFGDEYKNESSGSSSSSSSNNAKDEIVVGADTEQGFDF